MNKNELVSGEGFAASEGISVGTGTVACEVELNGDTKEASEVNSGLGDGRKAGLDADSGLRTSERLGTITGEEERLGAGRTIGDGAFGMLDDDTNPDGIDTSDVEIDGDVNGGDGTGLSSELGAGLGKYAGLGPYAGFEI